MTTPAHAMLHRTFSEIIHSTPQYGATVALRRVVLRTPLGLDFTADELASEQSDYHLACYDDGDLVACLVLVPLAGGRIKMRQVAVAPPMQSRGIGRELVRFAEDFARQRSFTQMTIHARTSAVPFYEKLGYERVGKEFVEVSIPHWEMQKRLSP